MPRCKCKVDGPCDDTNVGDGGMCRYCSYVHTGLMTNTEYWEKNFHTVTERTPLMRGSTCGMHPARVMGKKSSPCGRTDKAVMVEDHGNGFMFVGTTDIDQARRLLVEYVDDPEHYVFAARTWLPAEGAHGVWLSVDALAVWDGATSAFGSYAR